MDGSAFNRLGEGLGFLFCVMLAALAIFVPLGIWKAVEIVIWLVGKIEINWT